MAVPTMRQRLDRQGLAASSMTGEQARTLKSLSQEGRDPDAFQKNLSEEGAEVRIRILQAKLAKDKGGRQHKPN